jgi:hypothetical protein
LCSLACACVPARSRPRRRHPPPCPMCPSAAARRAAWAASFTTTWTRHRGRASRCRCRWHPSPPLAAAAAASASTRRATRTRCSRLWVSHRGSRAGGEREGCDCGSRPAAAPGYVPPPCHTTLMPTRRPFPPAALCSQGGRVVPAGVPAAGGAAQGYALHARAEAVAAAAPWAVRRVQPGLRPVRESVAWAPCRPCATEGGWGRLPGIDDPTPSAGTLAPS